MSDKKCPSQDELLSFVDADLPPEQLARIEKHLELCSSCAKQAVALGALLSDVGAPLGTDSGCGGARGGRDGSVTRG